MMVSGKHATMVQASRLLSSMQARGPHHMQARGPHHMQAGGPHHMQARGPQHGPTKVLLRGLLAALWLAVAPAAAIAVEGGQLLATCYLPDGYATDGSSVYRQPIQRAIDEAAKARAIIVFPPIVYGVDEVGFTLPSGTTARMAGATFLVSKSCSADGAVFTAHDATQVTIEGGTIIGHNASWPDGVNIRGVHITGRSGRIRIRDMEIRDLSSNGIGIFGSEETPVRDVWIEDTIVENCCNRYPDYLSGEKAEKGSSREDQGLIACYWVDDFSVSGCRLERSRSDGTHFYRCRRGQFLGNRVYAAKMGGYFIETCEDIVAQSNVLIENGSRGATIERGSLRSVFSGNTIARSGREGLWAPDCVGCVVTGNIFDRNGRKPNGQHPRYTWNANITINEAHGDPSDSPTADYLVAHNLIYSTADQIAAVRVDANETTARIVVRDNLLQGENRNIRLEGPRRDEVVLADNDGATVDRP